MANTVDIPLHIELFLNGIAASEQLKEYEISVGPGNKKGVGYLGEMTFVTLTDKSSGKAIDLVIKKAFDNEAIRNAVPIRESFENEAYFYTTIIPRFFKFEEEYKVKNKMDNVPKCLGTSLEICKEFILLENLKPLGYEVFDKKKPVDKQHIESIFKIFGKIHGLSFVFNKQRPIEFKTFTDKLHNVFILFNKSEMFQTSVINIIEDAYGKLIPGTDDEVIKAYKKYLDNPVEIFERSLIHDTQYKVINHGDCWSNNMMFKYNDGHLIDIKLLDFQMVSAGSPVQDLSYSLYSGASKEAFNDIDRLLAIYHDSLSSYVSQFGESGEELYPMEMLKRDWKRYSKFGMIMGTIILRMKMTVEKDLKDLTDFESVKDISQEDIKKVLNDMGLESGYDERVRDIVLNMYKYGAL